MTLKEQIAELKRLHKRLDRVEEWINENFHSEDCYDTGEDTYGITTSAHKKEIPK